jgi:hypothetical protein
MWFTSAWRKPESIWCIAVLHKVRQGRSWSYDVVSVLWSMVALCHVFTVLKLFIPRYSQNQTVRFLTWT